MDDVAPGTGDAAAYEQAHVHEVYDAIADHFSATRYAPWPLVARFLAAQPEGSIGLDAGCGNGKYLGGGGDGAATAAMQPNGQPCPPLFVLGCDRSAALVQLASAKHARGQPTADVLLADSLALPFRDGCADFAICIAVVHHLSTRARRQAAVAELLRCVKKGRRGQATTTGAGADTAVDADGPGRILVYVWALEQASSRRGWSAGGAQDLLVPWVRTARTKKSAKNMPDAEPPPPPATYQRYYHLYRAGELEEDVRAAGGQVLSSGYERDNWWVVAQGQGVGQDGARPEEAAA